MSEQWRANLGGERRGIDDAARALGDEMSSRDLIGQEYAARIDGEIEVPVRVGEVKRMAHGRHARVGDADVAAPEMRERLTERALDRRALAHIDLDSDGVFADLPHR